MNFFTWMLSFSLMVGTSNSWAKGGTVGNGGDGVAAEFVLTAQTAIELLKGSNLDDTPEFNLNGFIGAVSSASVSSEDNLFLDGVEVDAINYPKEQKLKISRARWMPLRMETQTIQRMMLVIHEYLWLAGVDDVNYRVSKVLIQKMSPSKFNTQRWWEPMNPTNTIGFNYTVSGCGESHGNWSIEFDLKQDNEDKTLFIEPKVCGSEKFTVHANKKTGYGASSDGLKGKYHVFEITINDQFGKLLGKTTYEPEWGRCLVMTDSTCSQSGKFQYGALNFSFQMRN